jgi:hypothetical protein
MHITNIGPIGLFVNGFKYLFAGFMKILPEEDRFAIENAAFPDSLD